MTTIRRQLTRNVLLAFAVPLLAGGLGGFFLIRAELLAQFDAALWAKAEAIVSVTTWDAGRLTVDASERFMREFDAVGRGREPQQEDAAIARLRDAAGTSSGFEMWRTDGTTLARAASLGQADLPFVATAPPRTRPRFWNVTLPSGLPGRAVACVFGPRMPHEGAPPGPIDVVLVVASDRRLLDRTLETLAFVLGGVGLLLVTLTMLVVPRVLRRELRPLETLAERASGIDAGSLGVRFPIAALPGELVPISHRLNDLLSRLEEAFERERRFSADVAHELRTPIAELRTLAELSLKWPDARDAAVDDEVLGIARHMEGIVTRLLALLRSERGQLPVTTSRVDVAALLREVWRPFAARAAERQLEVTWQLREDAAIETDPVLLRAILANLLENAVDYTPSRGAIRIEDVASSAGFSLIISNSAGELAQDDVPKLFDRFWRHDAARAGAAERSGLGLSLSRAFAHALRCTLTATLEPDSRLVLTLSGPSTPPV